MNIPEILGKFPSRKGLTPVDAYFYSFSIILNIEYGNAMLCLLKKVELGSCDENSRKIPSGGH